jgi:periplasmic copper chaperone A
MIRKALSAALVAAGIGCGAHVAHAHPSLQVREAAVGAPYRAVMSIPHGCEGSATLTVRVQVPEGVIGVKPMPKPGWTVSTVRGPYARSYPYYHGQTLSEGVKEIAWTGRLLDEHFDEFTFAGFLANTLLPGSTVHFPTTQECEKGAHRWVEIPASGQDAHALASPAPGLKLLPAAQKTAAAKTYKVGSLLIEGPWARATPGGARVAGGYVKITNNGPQADRLIGGTLPIAAEVEVHEMAMADNVMRMRKLGDGLEIGPGQSVELKPGGYHLMFMGLKSGLTQGQTIKGTLRFEKAGSVEVEFRVAPIGASSSGGHTHH